jgi:hypothetical protein
MNNNRSQRTIIDRSLFKTQLEAGIDKLVLSTKDFEVKDTKPLNIQPLMKPAGKESPEQESGFLFMSAGQPVFGAKAFLNTDHYQVNIGQLGLSITLNPSKILHPYELLTNESQLAEVCSRIESELYHSGLGLSIAGCNVARLDIAKQASMPRPVSAYAPAFDMLRFKGTRSQNINHGAETFSVRSKSIEASFYDKIKEINPTGQPSDFMRAEMRFRKRTAVSRYVGARSLAEVIQIGQEGWNHAYTSYLGGRVFVNAPEQQAFDFVGLNRLIDELYLTRSKGIVSSAVEVLGTRAVFEEIGIDRFLAAFAHIVDERTLRRHRERLWGNAGLSNLVGKPVSSVQLIDELRNYFVHHAA